MPSILPSKGPSIPCGGPCDDGNICTNDYCDIVSDTCKSEPMKCGEDQACDAFTGLCEDVQVVVPCIAVVDEWDDRDYSVEWAKFRLDYPKRPFCLLVPNDVSELPQWSVLPEGFKL